MPDPMRGRYCRKGAFLAEFNAARERLADLGGTLEEGVHDFEAFTFNVPGKLRLIFYPHTTRSTGNRHIRVRTSGKFDPQTLRAAIFALAENSCTFQFPADGVLHQEAVSAAVLRSRYAKSATA